MKTIRNLVSVMAAMAITAVSAADVTPKTPVSNETHFADPYFSKKGDRVILTLLNVDLDDVRIKVVDYTGRILYTEVIEDEMVIEKAFNFENAYNGEYRVVVEQDGEKFIEKIKVNS